MAPVCVIPARLNSSRFPGKLLAKTHGKTVLQHTWDNVAKCQDLASIFVATDSEEIGDHITSLGGKILWTSSTCRNGTERILEAFLKTPELQKASCIVNVQGDHPCTRPETISAIIRALEGDAQAVMATPVTKITSQDDLFSPHRVKCVFDIHHNALYFSRSPIPYGAGVAYAHIGMYCYRPSFFKENLYKIPSSLQKSEDLEQLWVLENGHRIKIACVEETLLGVDTPQDLELLQEILCRSNISSSQGALSPL
jgi:3-deoxy-manno-octulosonate cytidylyltransferase (CMP-KDO synthetase)